MSIEVHVPQLPESVADATLVSWHKKPGDSVARDENLVDLETDKVVLEVPAPIAGVLAEIKLANGATVTSGQLLAVIEPLAAGVAPASSAASAPVAKPADAAPGKLSPAAKRVVEENRVDPASVPGSGRDGRVSKSDVVNYLAAKDQSPATKAVPASPSANAAPAPAPAAPPVVAALGRRGEQRVPMTRLRARIAERMVQAQATQALLTSFNEIDLHAVNELRARYKEPFEKKYGAKLGFMSFFTKAAVHALKSVPAVNAQIDGDTLVENHYFDIGVAVSTEKGLMVPVIKDCDSLSMAAVENAIAGAAKRARDGKITLADLEGGVFTITNGGTFGSLLSTPIINPPQSAILGMHSINERPIAVNGQVVIRPMMYLALSYDHRIVDGRQAVTFLVKVKQAIEDPTRILLSV